MNLFHRHRFPQNHATVVTENKELRGVVNREVAVGDDWTCTCGKVFYVFTMDYDGKGNELPQWREAGKFK